MVQASLTSKSPVPILFGAGFAPDNSEKHLTIPAALARVLRHVDYPLRQLSNWRVDMSKSSKATQQQQANRNKNVRERLNEEHPERIRSSASKQLPTDGEPEADQQPGSSVAGAATKPKIRSQDVTGLKYFDKLGPLLERLHDDGC